MMKANILLSYRRWLVVLVAVLLLDPWVLVQARGGRGGGSSSGGATTSTSTGGSSSSSNAAAGVGAGFVAGTALNRNRNRNNGGNGEAARTGNFTDDEFLFEDGNFTDPDGFMDEKEAKDDGGSMVNMVPIVSSVAGSLFAIMCFVGMRKRDGDSSPVDKIPVSASFSNNKYSVALKAAKEAVELECLQGGDGTDLETAPIAPSDGTYQLMYKEKGETFTSTHEFTFVSSVNHASGWDITGKGKDPPDGTFVITEGLVAPSGQAYWVEQCSDGTSFSKGCFTLPTVTASKPFTLGVWMADNGVSGPYTGSKYVADGDGATSLNSSEEEPEVSFDPNDSP